MAMGRRRRRLLKGQWHTSDGAEDALQLVVNVCKRRLEAAHAGGESLHLPGDEPI